MSNHTLYISGVSRPNSALYFMPNQDDSGIYTPGNIVNHDIKYSDGVCEWAARICYNSNSKFATAPKFIDKLMEVGHYDVIEHAAAEFLVSGMNYEETATDIAKLLYIEPYIRVADYANGRGVTFSANMRVWRNLHYIESTTLCLPEKLKFLANQDGVGQYLASIAPNMFSMYASTEKSRNDYDALLSASQSANPVAPITTSTGAVVTLLGYNISLNPKNNHATFQIDNVSRAFTHQHVRHRLFSHSQESHRYVDMSDAKFIMPTGLSPEQEQIFADANNQIVSIYRQLRKSGVRKEDARAILPTSVSTRIITSGYMDSWNHYLHLRKDKAAQTEIRHVAESVSIQLESAGLI